MMLRPLKKWYACSGYLAWPPCSKIFPSPLTSRCLMNHSECRAHVIWPTSMHMRTAYCRRLTTCRGMNRLTRMKMMALLTKLVRCQAFLHPYNTWLNMSNRICQYWILIPRTTSPNASCFKRCARRLIPWASIDMAVAIGTNLQWNGTSGLGIKQRPTAAQIKRQQCFSRQLKCANATTNGCKRRMSTRLRLVNIQLSC